MKLQVLKSGRRVEVDQIGNVYCPTGKGGGIDPTCKRGGKGGRVGGAGGSKGRPLTESETEFVESKAFRMDKMPQEPREIFKSSGLYEREIKHFNSLIPALGKEQAVKIYDKSVDTSGYKHAAMFRKLRNGETPDGTKEMDDFVKHGNKSDSDVLYKGIPKGKFWNDLQKKSVGDSYDDKAFVSTSESQDTAARYSNRRGRGGVVQIEGTKGKGTYAPLIVWDGSGGDKEVLLPRGSKFKILEKGKNFIKVKLVQ